MSKGRESRVARVLLDSSLPQLDHLFDYAVPGDLRETVAVGQRVRVPFRSGGRKNFGWIIELAETSSFDGELSEIAELVSPVQMLTPDVWRLARAVSDRGAGSACDILRLAIPKRYVRVESAHIANHRSVEENTEVSDSEAPADEAANATAELLLDGERLSLTESHGPVRLSTGEWVFGWAKRMAEHALAIRARGRSVIVCVPDYRDLEQFEHALEAMGYHTVIRLDARQAGSERYRAFLRALEPEPHIIVGNRSAVYAPAHDLGAILIWDDGDPLFEEPLAPYVHCRDAALVRAQQSGAGLLFAAHSRSLEVHRLITLGYVKAATFPPKRARIRHADQAVAPDAFAGRVPGFVISVMNEGLRTGPVLVQVARPGFAPWAVCADCAEIAHCQTCQGPISYTQHDHPACRICGEHARGWSCGSCGGTALERRGAGSRLTADQFAVQFPHARILVSDGANPRTRVDSRPAIVIATVGAEPMAAGGYRAVVLLDAPTLLGVPSLRAEENCLRWWENAAALTASDGLCVLAAGSGSLVNAFLRGTPEAWLTNVLRERAELQFPPAVRTATLQGSAKDLEIAQKALGDADKIDVLGPVPVGEGRLRSVVRFPYRAGADIARRLRGAIVAQAAGAYSRRPRGNPSQKGLRVKFDDRGVFDTFAGGE